jgi:hypothetical protein
MAMMKARKAKRYAEGGDVDYSGNPKPKDPTKLVMPGAGYTPGMSAEHLYFQPDTQKIAENAAAASAAASAAPADNGASSQQPSDAGSPGNAKGGVIKMKKMAMGGAVKSGRGDGCAAKGKTKGRMV